MSFEFNKNIKLYDEKNKIIDNDKLEIVEQELAHKFVNENDTVLELGARYGSVTCVISKKLNEKNNLVCVEPDNRVWDALEKNLSTNNCKANVVKGFLSKKKIELTNLDCYKGGYGSTFVVNNESKTNCYTLNHIKNKYNIEKFTALIADCEGFLEVFFDENPELFKELNLVMYEADYKNKCNYDKIRKNLIDNGFELVLEKYKWIYYVWKK